MAEINRRTMVGLLGTAPFAGALLVRGQAQDPTSDLARKFENISSRERLRQRYFPNLTLTTHTG